MRGGATKISERGAGGAESGHGFAIFFRVLEFAIEGGQIEGEGRFQLLEVAGQDDQARRARGDGERGGVRGRRGAERPARGTGAQIFELTDQVTAQAVEFAHGQDDGAFQFVFQAAEGKGRSTEAAELFPKPVRGQRLILRGGQRQGRIDLRDVPQFVASDEGQGRGGVAVDFQVEGPAELRGRAGKTPAQGTVQLRIARLPDFVAGMNAVEMNFPEEADFGFGAAGQF